MALGKLGKYERVDVLGHGASGIVYLAWDTLLKKQIALKEIDVQSADVSRFLEEARVMDRLRHPNIVRVNGVDRLDGHIVIDMEYVKGQNLQQLLRSEGRLPVDQAVEIAVQTLDALDYAHSMRTVHRDIKPANILVSREGAVKLVDFGLAEILATNSYAGGAGTYAYMAPEDFAEEHHSDHLSDIWAVGVTLYEMVTAARPFNVTKAKDPFAWRRVLMNEAPTPLSEHLSSVPEGLQEIVDHALAREKNDRYQTAGVFRDALRALQQRHGWSTSAATLSGAASHAAAFGSSDEGSYKNGNGHNGNGAHSSPSGRLQEGPTLAFPPSPLMPVQTPLGQFSLRETEITPPPVQAEQQQKKAGLRLPFGRKEVTPVVASVEPAVLDFGELRKGDDRTGRVQVRFEGGAGKVSGQLASAPAWATVFPTALNRRRQTITVTVHSDRVWQTGLYEDVVRLDTTAGEVRIPIALRVLKARQKFQEVAIWLVPLFIAVLLPALTVAWAGQQAHIRYLVPSAALGSGLLAAMLSLVVLEADLGFAEKSASGVLLAVMTMVLGITVGVSTKTGAMDSLNALPATGVPMGIVLAIQAFNRRYWQIWAAAIVVLSLIAAGTFASVLSGRI